MSQRQLASVLFAVLGVFIAIGWLPQLILAIGIMKADDQAAPAGYGIAFLISAITAVVLGIVLVVARTRLTERLFPDDTRPLTAQDTQAVALSVLGCYFTVVSICRLVGRDEIDWPAATQLVLGIGLFFGARGLARLWTAARSAGSSGSDERAA